MKHCGDGVSPSTVQLQHLQDRNGNMREKLCTFGYIDICPRRKRAVNTCLHKTRPRLRTGNEENPRRTGFKIEKIRLT